MSAVTLNRTTDQRIDEKKPTLVELFHAYCSHEFGNDKWEEFMMKEEFNKMMTDYQPKYGDTIFSVLADIVCEVQNIEIKDLLRDFSKFTRTYY